MRRLLALMLAVILAAGALPVFAQGGGDGAGSGGEDTPAGLPVTFQMSGFRHEWQGWNNCGPATVTTGLSYFGWPNDQYFAAGWLKPDDEDKNVSPSQMAEFVNTLTPYRALVRYGGDLEMLQTLVTNNFPVLIEEGYQPEGYDWMGHYLLVMGYDRQAGTVLTQDSFLGPDRVYPQDELESFWRHFNNVYIVLYPEERVAALAAVLGEHFDEEANLEATLLRAQADAAENQADPFAWFNLGTSFTLLEQYEQAALAFDYARSLQDPGLPWRMLWYQFGPFEAYYAQERYEDVLALAAFNINTTPNMSYNPVEETYYYAGLARLGLGEIDRAINNFQQAVIINPNFSPAKEQLLALQGSQ